MVAAMSDTESAATGTGTESATCLSANLEGPEDPARAEDPKSEEGSCRRRTRMKKSGAGFCHRKERENHY